MSTMEQIIGRFSNVSRETVGEMQIFTASVMFGFSFVFQKYAMTNGFGPFAFNAYRYAAATILVYSTKSWMMSVVHSDKSGENIDVDQYSNMSHSERSVQSTRDLWFWGFLCGITMFGGATLQQWGLVTVPAAKAGFMCGCYVILIPIVLWMVPNISKKPCKWTWISATLSIIGLYLLSGCSEGESCVGGTFTMGELYIFIGTFFWAANIILVDIAANKVNAVELTANYFLQVTVMSVFLALLLEFDSFTYPFKVVADNWLTLCLVSFISCFASILATLGQMYTLPSRAGMIFSMESVLCAIFSFFILHEQLTVTEMMGCGIMFCSVILFSLMTGKQEENENDVINHLEDVVEQDVEYLCELVRHNSGFGRGEAARIRTTSTEYGSIGLTTDPDHSHNPSNRPHRVRGNSRDRSGSRDFTSGANGRSFVLLRNDQTGFELVNIHLERCESSEIIA